jgi:hypothetical protein
MRWARHVARREEMRNVHKILVESLKGRDYSEDLGVGGRIIKWTEGKYGWRVWIELICLRTGTGGGLL